MSVRRAALVLLLIVPLLLSAQQLAPQNDSIRKEDLKADLYFLAHDLTQGRLVGTPGMRSRRNSSSRDSSASAWRRPDQTDPFFRVSTWRLPRLARTTAWRSSIRIRSRPAGRRDRTTIRCGSAPARASRVRWCSRASASPRRRSSYDDYRGDSVKGKIALILDHEPGERDPASPFDGVVTAEAAVPFRKVLAAQEQGAIGVLFVSDVHNHPGVPNFEAAAQAYWPPKPPRIEQFFLSDYIDKIRIPAAQISPALASILIRGTDRTLEEMSRSAETARPRAVGAPGLAGPLTVSVNRHIVADRSIVALLEGRIRS